MAVSLLATKLYTPPLRAGLVSRPRLTDRLAEGLAYTLTLISPNWQMTFPRDPATIHVSYLFARKQHRDGNIIVYSMNIRLSIRARRREGVRTGSEVRPL